METQGVPYLFMLQGPNAGFSSLAHQIPLLNKL